MNRRGQPTVGQPFFHYLPSIIGLLLHHWPIKPSYMYHSTPRCTKRQKVTSYYTILPTTHCTKDKKNRTIFAWHCTTGGREEEGEREREEDTHPQLGVAWGQAGGYHTGLFCFIQCTPGHGMKAHNIISCHMHIRTTLCITTISTYTHTHHHNSYYPKGIYM